MAPRSQAAPVTPTRRSLRILRAAGGSTGACTKPKASYESDGSIDIHSTPPTSPTKASDGASESESSSSSSSSPGAVSLKVILESKELNPPPPPRQKVKYNIQGYLDGIKDLKPKDDVVMFPPEHPPSEFMIKLAIAGRLLGVFFVILFAVCLGNYIVKHYL